MAYVALDFNVQALFASIYTVRQWCCSIRCYIPHNTTMKMYSTYTLKTFPFHVHRATIIFLSVALMLCALIRSPSKFPSRFIAIINVCYTNDFIIITCSLHWILSAHTKTKPTSLIQPFQQGVHTNKTISRKKIGNMIKV